MTAPPSFHYQKDVPPAKNKTPRSWLPAYNRTPTEPPLLMLVVPMSTEKVLLTVSALLNCRYAENELPAPPPA